MVFVLSNEISIFIFFKLNNNSSWFQKRLIIVATGYGYTQNRTKKGQSKFSSSTVKLPLADLRVHEGVKIYVHNYYPRKNKKLATTHKNPNWRIWIFCKVLKWLNIQHSLSYSFKLKKQLIVIKLQKIA